MNKFILQLFIFLPVFAISQKLPMLNVRNPSTPEFDLPTKLEKNEVCTIICISGGGSAYDNKTYYVFKENGSVEGFTERNPKPYLKKYPDLKKTREKILVDSISQKSLIACLHAKQTSDFLKYSQADFSIPTPKPPYAGPCVSDAAGYTITFIQNNKFNSYSYYEPKYYLTECMNPSINKKVLEKFVALLKLWKADI